MTHQLLPPNATKIEQALAAIIQEQFDKLPMNVKRELWNPDKCPVHLLPWLAWTFGLESWDNTWSESIKRARIREAIPIAKSKGTLGSIRRLLKSYGGNIAIREWWQTEPKGEPHTFEIVLTLSGNDGEAATAEFITSVMRDIDRTKPVRSHYTATQGVQFNQKISAYGFMRIVAYTRL